MNTTTLKNLLAASALAVLVGCSSSADDPAPLEPLKPLSHPRR
ncbi:MAG: hypothetical protein AAGF72_09995 [Pseudomonadota bacterium]